MANITNLVKIDDLGRVLIPKRIRNEIGVRQFEINIANGKIELTPVKHPLELFGTLEGVDIGELDGIHGEEHDLTS
ncbi:MAG: AbrB/MazE/SpoVT family DNA-binding domain-containing protein [Thermoplasmata archaeon]|nr:AbrB/MazE/SpoVT family DNA-binding domain-containing protein [Thermoplasmata archaeon]